MESILLAGVPGSVLNNTSYKSFQTFVIHSSELLSKVFKTIKYLH